MKDWEGVGARIKSSLKEKNMTQIELGEKLGVDASTVCNWIHGRYPIKVDTVNEIADILRVPFEYLTTGRYPDFGDVEPQGENKMVTIEVDGVKKAIWLSEAEISKLNKRTIKLTRREKEFLNCFEDEGWVCRAFDGELYVCVEEKEYALAIDNSLFGFVTWDYSWSFEQLEDLEVEDQ